MPSAFILAVRGYPALPRARQLAHQRYVPLNPLVLERKPLKSPAPTTDRDRPVSRRSKPSSRTAFIGEQPNPWDLLQPQDAMHDLPRHSRGVDYITIPPDPDGSSASDRGRPDYRHPISVLMEHQLSFGHQSLRGQRSLYCMSGITWGRIKLHNCSNRAEA